MDRNTSSENDSARYYSNSEDISRLKSFFVINSVLNAPLMITSIIANALVLAAILRTPSLRSPSLTLLCSLAVSDFLVGIVVQPLYIVNQIANVRACPKLRITEIMQFSLCGVSLCTITSISLDRFAALHYHMRYAAVVTVRRVTYTLIAMWISAFTLSGFYFWNKNIFFAGTGVAICVCFLISTFSYIRIFRIVQQHQLRIYFQRQVIQGSEENKFNMVRLKRSAINTFIFYVFIILCYLPMLISLSLYVISRDDWTTIWNLADTVLFMNSTLNPFLYCWRLRELRTAVLKAARRVFCQKRQN
ncbi:melanocyte-stimulating hormone receptor-like [Orbicella faveolata]|uniref:melanocyte-stimulating hormone receptor-like n=1 Tax=Orbicella faveolata TaxID=48498 RepID=UPI0009E55667|nr:melanocyte-stimulating hormone receptor-like [Orbicella faveolata]